MALHPDSYEADLSAREMLAYSRRQLPSYYGAETELPGRNLGIRDHLIPSLRGGVAGHPELPERGGGGKRETVWMCVR